MAQRGATDWRCSCGPTRVTLPMSWQRWHSSRPLPLPYILCNGLCPSHSTTLPPIASHSTPQLCTPHPATQRVPAHPVAQPVTGAHVAVCQPPRRAIGARLCTVDEIWNDIPQGTGCFFDDKQIWSADTCAGGHTLSPSRSVAPTWPSATL